MNVKLTLNLNKEIIERTKDYARNKNQNLSALVQNYFIFLSEKKTTEEFEISPNVKELSGIINLDGGFDLKND